jgi:hypothetical protein
MWRFLTCHPLWSRFALASTFPCWHGWWQVYLSQCYRVHLTWFCSALFFWRKQSARQCTMSPMSKCLASCHEPNVPTQLRSLHFGLSPMCHPKYKVEIRTCLSIVSICSCTDFSVWSWLLTSEAFPMLQSTIVIAPLDNNHAHTEESPRFGSSLFFGWKKSTWQSSISPICPNQSMMWRFICIFSSCTDFSVLAWLFDKLSFPDGTEYHHESSTWQQSFPHQIVSNPFVCPFSLLEKKCTTNPAWDPCAMLSMVRDVDIPTCHSFGPDSLMCQLFHVGMAVDKLACPIEPSSRVFMLHACQRFRFLLCNIMSCSTPIQYWFIITLEEYH